MRFIRLECQKKYFPYGPKSRLIRVLLYTYTNKIVYDEILRVRALFIVLVRCPVHTPVRTPMYGLPLSQSDPRIRSVFQSVYNNNKFLLMSVRLTSKVYCDWAADADLPAQTRHFLESPSMVSVRPTSDI